MITRFSFLKKFSALYIFTAAWLLFTGCDKKFDEPPFNQDPDIPQDMIMNISDLKARYTAAGSFQTIPDDKYLSGVVIADDKSGNFYKQLVIQDETGGMPVLMDGVDLYTKYPIGRRIFIKLKGLMLGDYGGNIQLGMDTVRNGSYLDLGRIPTGLFDSLIVKGSYGNVITPKVVKPSDFSGSITDPLLSTLVQINNAEFKSADLAKMYADPEHKSDVSAVNFTIKPCDDTKSIVLRNSSYANFAGLKVPQGNGPLVGVPGVFNGTLQMFIRDTSDVQFKNTRCDGQIPVDAVKSIADVLKYATGDSTIPAGVWIEGVVVSSSANESSLNYRLQDNTAGVQIRFGSSSYDPKAALNSKLKVYVGGLKLSLFSGGLQISGVETSTNTGSGTITPKVTTIANIIANERSLESTVVTINNVTFTKTGSSSTGDTYSVTDATGQISTFVRNTSGITIYDSANSITGYISVYKPAGGNETAQITLRTQEDIIGGRNATATPPPASGNDLIISEYVEGSSNNKYIELYNAGSTDADLSLYSVALYANGSTSANTTVVLSDLTKATTLSTGKTIVIQNASAKLTLPTGVTAYSSGVCNFNGDDVIELSKSGSIIDVFGLKGIDPGTSWSIAGDANAAVDKTVRRKTSITSGNTDWSASAGTNETNSQWIVVSTTDDVSNLGTR